MATSLQFHTDPALQILVGTHALNHLVDGSNDPQDLFFYYGSPNALNKFEKSSDPGIDELVVEITNQTPVWLPSVAKVVNEQVRTTAKNGFVFKAQAIAGAGLTGGSEPSWPLVLGQTVVDNQVTWVNDGAFHETNEIKLSLDQIGLDTAVAGASLTIGTLINGGDTNAVLVYVRADDATAMIGDKTELGLIVRDILEQPI